jgi:tetratricopeptide (TPR) repeat protein/tRNA A-37 threonylcarbamoyl transferase component Bud32
MQNGEVDRNVLFGVLAWQLGVVDRDPLMSAMYSCMTDKTRTLPDVLVATGALSAEDRAWVEQCVERQLRKHANDPSRTLANLHGADDLRRSLTDLIVGDAGVTLAAPEGIDPQAKTLAVPGTIDESFDVDAGIAVRGPTTEHAHADRFRIVRPHARGGLGEVFVAVDEELKREVALKQILSRHAENRTSRARFMLEAEVTGSLEHPGVVPVYGLGTQDDGRPYYAMRFIRGESLEDAIRKFHEADEITRDPGQRAIDLRNLLTRFVAVCNTIEYAHSRGIVHRDLKPENIMLGPYGETLVVDWGLARPFEQPLGELDQAENDELPAASSASTTERPTQMGTVVGTPQFMSPEQASGRIDLVRAASDVYSLGATLYCLLTDQPAFTSSDVRRVLRDVQTGVFQPPRAVKRDVPRGLEAICLRAMALKPEERYPSARALADDIEHWLADEPVSALGETAFERMQRWARRHKTWTQAAAAAVIVVAMVSWFAYAREAGLRSDLQKSLTLEAAARKEADEARRLADRNAALAETEKKRAESHAHRAEQQSALALATLKSVLFDIQAKLKNVPAAHTVRLSMLNTVIDGLRQVAGSLDTAAEADHSLVRAHLDLGDIFLQVGAIESSGATLEAQRQFDRAVEIAEKLHKADAKSVTGRVDLAEGYQRKGDVSLQRGNLPSAAEWLRKSLDLRQQLSTEHRDDVSIERAVAASIQRLGMVNQQLGDFTAAKDYFTKFFEVSQRLVDRDPENVENRRNLSVSYERMGDISLLQGDRRAAEDFFRKSLEVRRPLAANTENNSVAVRDMSVTLDRLGDMALKRDDVTAASDFFTQSLELRKKLFDEDPNNVQAQRDLLVSYALLGDTALRKSEVEPSAEFYRLYYEMAQKLAAGDPENVQFQRDLATAYDRQGYVMLQLGKSAEARDFYRKNYDLIERLAAGEPENLPVHQDLARACATLGDLSVQLGDYTAAREYLSKYLAEARRRAADHADDRAARRALIDALLRHGDVLLRTGTLTQAGRELHEAYELTQKAVAADAADTASRMYLANAESMLAQYEVENRDPQAASRWAQSGIDDMRRVGEQADAALRSQTEPWIKEQTSLLGLCATAQKAAEDPAFAVKQEPALVADLLDFAAAAAVRARRWSDAEKVLDQLAKLDPKSPTVLFLAARRHAFAAAAAKGAEKDAQDRTSPWLQRTWDLLEQARVAKAFDEPQNAARLEHGDEFAPWKADPQFVKLRERLQPSAAKTAPAIVP